MEDLINSMTLEDPARRPRIEEVLDDFTRIRSSLSKAELQSPIMSRKLPVLLRMVQRVMQSLRIV
jgi:hypothetical protein